MMPSPDGLYLVGNWKSKIDPSRITVCVRHGATVHVAIVGWHPGTKLLVVGGPKWNVRKAKGWKKVDFKKDKYDDDDDHPGRGHGHDKGKHNGH